MKLLLTTRLFSVEHRTYQRVEGEPTAVGGEPATAGGEAATAGLEPVTRDVVVHPGAVVVLPVLDDGRLVMIRNYRYTVERELLELPAGTREPDESPEETAARELEEETGYRAARLEPLAAFYTSPGILTERMHAFIATGLTHVGQRLEDGERIVPLLVEPEVARRQWLSGEIEDGKTLAVLGLYFARGTEVGG